jgi:hypothetical protein
MHWIHAASIAFISAICYVAFCWTHWSQNRIDVIEETIVLYSAVLNKKWRTEEIIVLCWYLTQLFAMHACNLLLAQLWIVCGGLVVSLILAFIQSVRCNFSLNAVGQILYLLHSEPVRTVLWKESSLSSS